MKHGRTVVVFGLGLLVAVVASAHPRQSGGQKGAKGELGEQHREMRVGKMAEVLDLDEGQKVQVEAIFEQARVRHTASREAAKERHQELRSLLDSVSPDPTRVGTLMIEMHQSRQLMGAEREQVHSDIAALLTPDQLERLDAVKEMRSDRDDRRQRQDRRGAHRHQRHGG